MHEASVNKMNINAHTLLRLTTIERLSIYLSRHERYALKTVQTCPLYHVTIIMRHVYLVHECKTYLQEN